MIWQSSRHVEETIGCWPEVMSGGDTWYWVTWFEMLGSDRDPSVTRHEIYGTMSLGF
jgi:hypothetical protein